MTMTRVASCLTLAVLSGGALVCSAGCSLSHPTVPADVGPVVAEALLDAHRADRPVLINSTSKWCEPCKQFALDACASPTLAQAVSVFKWVTIDSTAHPADCEALDIEAYPTFLILSPGGAMLARWVGYMRPAETAGRLIEELFHAGREMEYGGRPQRAYCLYQWAVQAGESSPLVDAARKAATRLLEEGKAKPNAHAQWTLSRQLASRLNG